jgi:IMP dehydrogenase
LGVCLHRFPKNDSERNWGSPEGQIKIFKSLADTSNVFVSVGLNDFDRVKLLAEAGVTNWLIDMANGYMHKAIAESVRKIKEIAPINNLMVGNVHTNLGVFNIARELNYLKCPVYVRVGIAGGSPCATNDSTGYNRGQITELQECADFRDYCCDAGCDLRFSDPKLQEICDCDIRIVADGGIKNSGYASKAFGAGADAIIMGGYFARAEEAETNLHGDGTYWGGASEKQQILATGQASRHSEGKEFAIDEPILPLEKLVSDLWGGISSAVSYGGYDSLIKFIYNGTFEVKENSLPPRRK